jgi:sialate O-acetylesterase
MRRDTTETRRRAHMVSLSVLGVLLVSTVAVASPGKLLHSMFQDHAVLQRDQPVTVWGVATPSQTVTISFASQTATAHTDAQGRWKATLAAMPAGGPFVLDVRSSSGAVQTVNDVLVGDVWLCSGQSNMVLPVHRALDSRAEIANSANDRIRMMTIGLASEITPQEEFAAPVQWQVAAPATVPEFSAACFYFARELQKTVAVPFGLINASWGGSRIEAWMSRQSLHAVGSYEAALDVQALYAADASAAAARWGSIWESWWRKQPATRGIADPWSIASKASQWRAAPRELVPWEKWKIPELEDYNGMLWYRTSVKLSAQQAQQRARLSLGQVDEADQTWVNGRSAGATADARGDSGFADIQSSGPKRIYYLPAGALRAGENVIVVNVLDTYASGGLYGPTQSRVLQFADGTAVPLDGDWHFQIPPAGLDEPPREPWASTAGLSTIHNAMIAPLAAYSLCGVAWYQGESNTTDAARYRELLPRFMADWRHEFSAPQLPFLIVQLANYGLPPTAPVESGWADVREAQRLSVNADPQAALAVTIDIGDRYDIHPANKQELGRRLARAARHLVYGEPPGSSGPVPRSARRVGNDVVVTFADVTGRLIAYGANEPIGFELCGAARNSCRFVRASVADDRVVLDATQLPASTRVRYCWADSPICTLYDASPLPAGPFELSLEDSQ